MPELEFEESGTGRSTAGGMLAVWRKASAAIERWSQRRRLLALDDRMLRDIGISRCDAEREAAKRWR